MVEKKTPLNYVYMIVKVQIFHLISSKRGLLSFNIKYSAIVLSPKYWGSYKKASSAYHLCSGILDRRWILRPAFTLWSHKQQRFFTDFLMVILFTLSVFARNLLVRESRQRNILSNKLTYYLIGYGQYLLIGEHTLW